MPRRRRSKEAAIRYAIYYAPAADHPLTLSAGAWLGRDVFGRPAGARPSVPPFSPDQVQARTCDARRYGFHATLKAPFRLSEDRSPEMLAAALESFATRTSGVALPGLEIANLDGFFALVPSSPSPALQKLAEQVVRYFEPFRAPLTPDEIARRRPERLSPRQRLYLEQFGYPHVLEEFRFHMTLTDRLPPDEQPEMRTALQEIFPSSLRAGVAVDQLALFREDAPGAPFVAEATFPLKDPA